MDNRNIYAEIPATAGGLPHVMTFSRSDTGLSKALNLLRDHTMQAGPIHDPKPKFVNNRVEEVLRSMGVIK